MYFATVYSQHTKTGEFENAHWGNVRNAALNYVMDVVEDREIHQVNYDNDPNYTGRFVITYRKDNEPLAFLEVRSELGYFVSREKYDLTDAMSFMDTCESCNNDHGIVAVRLGQCPYDYN